MSIEFNSHLPIGSTLTLSPGMGWNDVDMMYGSSAGAIKQMANAAGYEVVHMIAGFDMYLVQKELLNGLCPPPFASFGLKSRFFHYCVKDPNRRGKWMDYSTYKRTGDVGLAQQAAVEQMLLMRHPTDSGPSSLKCLGVV